MESISTAGSGAAAADQEHDKDVISAAAGGASADDPNKDTGAVALTVLASNKKVNGLVHQQAEAAAPFSEGSNNAVKVEASLQERMLQNAMPEGRKLLFLDVDGVLHPLRVRLLGGSQKVDASHCFQSCCMEQLKRVVEATEAKIILSSSWRNFEHTRDILATALATYGLSFSEWTTTAGGDSASARVDQILDFVGRASNVVTWAAVDDEDLAPLSLVGSESMMRAVFRQSFVRTEADTGLDSEKADRLISILLDGSDLDDSSELDESPKTCPAMAIARQCLPSFRNVGWATANCIDMVTSKLVQNLWSGLGSITELSLDVGGITRLVIMKSISSPQDPNDSEQHRDYKSYHVEARFYDQDHARKSCVAGALCPLPLLVDSVPDGEIRICMTRLPGWSCAGGAGKSQVRGALSWLARFHSMYWGHARADEAVQSGLHPQGCYWNLDSRKLELERTQTEGLEGRLRLAASALDSRLKADLMQTICHGDPKDANIIDAEDGPIGLCDFQWVGKAPPTKDVAYCLVCGAERLTTEEEEAYLQHYFGSLSAFLTDQGDAVPTFEQFRISYALSMCDLARWMAGWGWWGHVRIIKGHATAILGNLDGGEALSSEEEYNQRMMARFPCAAHQ